MRAVTLIGTAAALAAAALAWMRTGSEAGAAPPEVAAHEEPDFSPWIELYANASLEQIRQEIPLLRSQLDDGTLDWYEGEFARGAFVVEGRYETGEGYRIPNPRDELCARRFLRDGSVVKVVLPKEEFPEMYELRDQLTWLSHREDELSRWGDIRPPR